MLTLRENWRGITGGSVAADLIRQGADDATRTEIARHLISASLDLMVAGFRRRTGNSARVQEWPDLQWRLGNLVYRYLPVVDDDALNSCSDSESCLPNQTLIVPAKCEWLLRQAMIATQGGVMPTVFSVDGFISWRTTFGSIDLGWTREQTVRDLLKRYNRSVRKARADESLLVDVEMDRESKEEPLQELRLTVPTYNGTLFPKQVAAGEKAEFGRPNVPVLVREAAGIRIVLGTHEFKDMDKPDIQVERQPNGWAIFLHPSGGGDPCGLIYFLDDGRSFLIRELDLSGTPMIRVLESDESIPEIHGMDE